MHHQQPGHAASTGAILVGQLKADCQAQRDRRHCVREGARGEAPRRRDSGARETGQLIKDALRPRRLPWTVPAEVPADGRLCHTCGLGLGGPHNKHGTGGRAHHALCDTAHEHMR